MTGRNVRLVCPDCKAQGTLIEVFARWAARTLKGECGAVTDDEMAVV